MKPDIPIAAPWTCPSCDGTGMFLFRATRDRTPCGFCNGTGDQREMPEAWKACPARNRSAYHESMR